MKIVLGKNKWNVVADWLGAERVVYSNSNIFACIRYVANNK